MMVYIPPKPAIWLPLDERSGTIAYDKSGNNRNGTLTGARWSQYHRGMLPGSGCALWFQFDEGQGVKLYDFSGYGNDGDIHGATWKRLNAGTWVLEFDGVDDEIEVPHSESLVPSDAITIMLWMRGEEKVGFQALIQKYPWYGYVTRYNSATGGVELFLRFSDGTTASFWAYGALPGRWCHLAFTFDKDLPEENMKIYINGEMSAHTAGAGKTLMPNTEPLKFGTGADVPYVGRVGTVLLFSRALTAEEVRTWYLRDRERGKFR